jgi:hypothetical protein
MVSRHHNHAHWARQAPHFFTTQRRRDHTAPKYGRDTKLHTRVSRAVAIPEAVMKRLRWRLSDLRTHCARAQMLISRRVARRGVKEAPRYLQCGVRLGWGFGRIPTSCKSGEGQPSTRISTPWVDVHALSTHSCDSCANGTLHGSSVRARARARQGSCGR